MNTVKIIKKQRALRKTRVAAYCRVSTDNGAQEESFETQAAFYTREIKTHDGWEFAGIYADRGLSGTATGARPGFQRMIDDALDGGIDLILCKSVSRFSRNVVDCQDAIRLLRDNGVIIQFEQEGIATSDPSANLMLLFRSIIAQSESESLSRNRLWANRARVLRGEYTAGRNTVLGYDAKNGKYVPNDKSWIIKKIFTLYAGGVPVSKIVKELNGLGAATLRGNAFTIPGVMTILENEIYVGDRRLQKRAPKALFQFRDTGTAGYATNYLTNDHPAIISRALWDRAQTRLTERKRGRRAGINIIRPANPAEQKHFRGCLCHQNKLVLS